MPPLDLQITSKIGFCYQLTPPLDLQITSKMVPVTN